MLFVGSWISSCKSPEIVSHAMQSCCCLVSHDLPERSLKEGAGWIAPGTVGGWPHQRCTWMTSVFVVCLSFRVTQQENLQQESQLHPDLSSSSNSWTHLAFTFICKEPCLLNVTVDAGCALWLLLQRWRDGWGWGEGIICVLALLEASQWSVCWIIALMDFFCLPPPPSFCFSPFMLSN